MKIILQRCKKASVSINKKIEAKINQGLVIFIGIDKNDNKFKTKSLVKKVLNLRIFNDSKQKMNLSIKEINGSALVVSQFTLCGDTKNGRRPSYRSAGEPKFSKSLYNYFIEEIKKEISVQTGTFGENMEVELINNGPATFILEN
jgi:D-tyrosyl-tRNA(Tyr) deacylase